MAVGPALLVRLERAVLEAAAAVRADEALRHVLAAHRGDDAALERGIVFIACIALVVDIVLPS